MFEYRIEVKPWMTKQFGNSIPMPLVIMYTGGKLDETSKAVKFWLHGDIKEEITSICMACGMPIKNQISRYFGMGPKCGGHNYVNPFDSQEELDREVKKYRDKLAKTTWTGWIPKSAIKSIDNNSDIQSILDLMPTEIIDDNPSTDVISDSDFSVNNLPVINARIDKPVVGTHDFSVFLSFQYNADIKDEIKKLGTHAWNSTTKEWEIIYEDLETLKNALPDVEFHIKNADILPQRLETTSFDYTTTPMEHQTTGVQYGLDHSRFLLADEQGLGKTKQIIDLAVIRKNALGIKHCLIVCGVNSLKWNWVEEIQKHSSESGYILGQKVKKSSGKLVVGGNADKLSDICKLLDNTSPDDFPYFLITNVESLRNTKISDALKSLCDTGIIGMVAIDEVHRCKGIDTQQYRGMLKLQPLYRVGMTGTPLMNSPLDLYAILKWLGYEPYEFHQFRNHFCEFDSWGNVVGYRNIDQLRTQLQSIMLRRLKTEVYDLPEKIYATEYVELTDEQKKLYNQIIDDAIISTTAPEETNNGTDCVLATMLRLRQVSGGIGPFQFINNNPKIDRLEQLVDEAIYSGTKVIIYSNWIEGLAPALERLQKYNPVVITGETKDSDRQALINKFQNDSDTKVILGTIGALGTGFTLTAASEVIFLDEPWTNAAKEQAVDRAHRIGTTSVVTVRTLISHGTYDEDVHDIVLGKKLLSDEYIEKKDLAKLRIS